MRREQRRQSDLLQRDYLRREAERAFLWFPSTAKTIRNLLFAIALLGFTLWLGLSSAGCAPRQRLIIEFYHPPPVREPVFVWECLPVCPGWCVPYLRFVAHGGATKQVEAHETGNVSDEREVYDGD